MKYLKVLSIIGVFFYLVICFLMESYRTGDNDESLAFGAIGMLGAIAFAVFVFLKTGNKKKHHHHSFGSKQDLLDLHELREKGILTEEEYQFGKEERKKNHKHTFRGKKELIKLHELKEKGILTEEEYQSEKMALLIK